MNYNFNELINRRGTQSEKWDATAEEVLPLWVADMDFRAPRPVLDALQRRIDHGIFGYAHVPQAYYDAITRWFSTRHHWQINPSHIIYTTGVIPAIAAALRAVTLPGEKVLIQSPVYNCFYSCIRNCGCEVLDSPLVRTESHRYVIDFDDLEAKADDERCVAMLLCNPHNPAGRVWTAEELKHIGDICDKHHVQLISDEIHCELIMPGHTFTPIASLTESWVENVVVTNSPTKSFNLAGLQVANIIAPNPRLRRQIDRAINLHETCDINPFGIDALIAAYNESGDWIDQLNEYLWENYQTLRQFVEAELPRTHLTPLEGTYLAWLDVRAYSIPTAEIEHSLKEVEKVWVNSGTLYGTEGFLRINIATPRTRLLEGLVRMARGLHRLASTNNM